MSIQLSHQWYFSWNFDTCRPRRARLRQSPSMSIQSMTYSVHTQRNHYHQDHNNIMNNQFKTLLTLFPISIHLCSSSFSPSRTVILCSNVDDYATPSHELKSPDPELFESSLLLLCLLLCSLLHRVHCLVDTVKTYLQDLCKWGVVGGGVMDGAVRSVFCYRCRRLRPWRVILVEKTSRCL